MKLAVKKDGRVIGSRANAILMFEEHRDYAGHLWLNTFDGDAYFHEERIDDGLMVAISRAAGDLVPQDAGAGSHRLLPNYFGTEDDRLHQKLGVLWGIGAGLCP